MKLALVISSMNGGGAERVMSLLANHWAARGEEVTLITLDRSDRDLYPLHPKVQRLVLGIMKPSGAPVAAIANNYRRAIKLRRALRSVGAPAVVSFGEQTNVLAVLATRGLNIRCVISERTDPRRHKAKVGKAWDRLRRWTYPYADALVVQSQAVGAWAAELVGQPRVHVIANPARDMSAYAATGKGERRIAAVGELRPEKGYDVLLRAFALIAAGVPEWKLVVVGDGPERPRLENLVATLGIGDQVVFPGRLPEPGVVLAAASLFVQPSRYEGFSNALLEAMGCGLPVISTATAGGCEMVTDETDGLLVAVESNEALAAAMIRLIEDAELRERLGRNALAASKRYDMDSIVARWDALTARNAASRRGSASGRIGKLI